MRLEWKKELAKEKGSGSKMNKMKTSTVAQQMSKHQNLQISFKKFLLKQKFQRKNTGSQRLIEFFR